MSGLYVSKYEVDALKSIDLNELERLVDEATWHLSMSDLRSSRLASCGDYVTKCLHRFEEAISAQRGAKSAKNRSEKSLRVRRAGMDLTHAVQDMKVRIENEAKEQELVFIDDVLNWSPSFTPNLRVRVSYRWRATITDEWKFGSITFQHEVDMRPDYAIPLPKRKPSRAKQEDELQDKLYRVWDQLRSSALNSVREFLKSDRDKSAIPEVFQCTIDSYTRSLNNYSTQFWREPIKPAS